MQLDSSRSLGFEYVISNRTSSRSWSVLVISPCMGESSPGKPGFLLQLLFTGVSLLSSCPEFCRLQDSLVHPSNRHTPRLSYQYKQSGDGRLLGTGSIGSQFQTVGNLDFFRYTHSEAPVSLNLGPVQVLWNFEDPACSSRELSRCLVSLVWGM